MFGTLQYDSNNNDIEFVEKADGFHSNLGAEQHSACDHCRAKKLRCSGYKNGCTRCKGLGRVCTYSGSRDGKGGKRRRRRDDSKSSISSAKATSTTAKNSRPTVNTNTPSANNSATMTPADSVKSFAMDTPIGSPMRSLDDPTNMWAEMLCDLSPGIPHFGLGNPMDRACLSPVSDPDKDGLLYDPMLMDSIIANEGHNPTTFLTDPGFFAETAHTMMSEPMSTINPSETEKFPSPPSSHRGSVSSYIPPPSAASIAAANNFFPTHTRSSSENIPSPASSQSMCSCLQPVVGLLDELDANTISGAATIDKMLSSQKEALDYSKNMLGCMQCATRSEHMTLLNFVATKMVALCEQIVERYAAHSRNPNAAGDFHQLNMARRNSSQRSSPAGGVDAAAAVQAANNMFLGDYEVSSPLEWDHLVRVLIQFQLHGLACFLAEMKKIAQPTLRDSQFSKLLILEGQVAELGKLMARVEKEISQR